MALDLSNLKKAVESLETALQQSASSEAATLSPKLREVVRAGVIQHFEFTYELCWKMLKRYLEQYSPEKPDLLTVKDLFRMGHEQGLLRDAAAWFVYLERRNLTSHTYRTGTAELVFNTAPDFLTDAKFLLHKLETRNLD